MPAKYYITEPAPSTTSYIRSGRGGAGNTFRVPSSNTTSTTPSSQTQTPSSSSSSSSSARRFFSGIGGAGNAHEASERPPVSLDDEVRRLAARDAPSVGHCGIGGAGNVYRRKASDASSSEEDSSSAAGEVWDDGMSSVSSVGSRARLWNRMTGKE